MKIAVIGGGIFGVSTAIRLADHHDVDLYEKHPDIFSQDQFSRGTPICFTI